MPPRLFAPGLTVKLVINAAVLMGNRRRVGHASVFTIVFSIVTVGVPKSLKQLKIFLDYNIDIVSYI